MVVETADKNGDGSGEQQAASGAVFIAIKSIPMRSYARDLRLREDDVIAAVDGVPCNLDIAEFEDLLLDARDDEKELFVTISRDRIFFEIFLIQMR